MFRSIRDTGYSLSLIKTTIGCHQTTLIKTNAQINKSNNEAKHKFIGQGESTSNQPLTAIGLL